MSDFDFGDFLPGHRSLQRLLLQRLSALNPNFTVSAYFEKFKKLKTNLDRVNYVYKDMKRYNLLPDLIKEGKDDRRAETTKEEGDEAFGHGDYKEALRLYTFSIATAKSTRVLALAYANRSATLYQLGRYKDCLMDIERALVNNYPDNLKPKLMTRRTMAEKMLNSSEPLEPYHEDIPQIPASKKHPTITSANKWIKIKTNEEFGRHIVATRDIQIGEILCVEKPYACALVTDRLTHCHTCLELCYNPIPCDKCIFLVFCSEDCKNEASITFHRYECSMIASLFGIGRNSSNLVAARVAVSAIHSFEPAEDGTYRSDRYKEVGDLMATTDKFEVEELYERAVHAACVFHIFLKRSSLFNCRGNIMKNQFKDNVLSQIIIHDLNALPISECVADFFGCEDHLIAVGVYSFASLFNHSCSPNVESIQYGSTTVLRTINTIKKGQQCCITYGPTYSDMSQLGRFFILKHAFFFACRCVACVKNWNYDENLTNFQFPFLHIDQVPALIMEIELKTRHCAAARRYLPYLMEQLERCERFEPRGPALKFKKFISACYRSFGNKRRP